MKKFYFAFLMLFCFCNQAVSAPYVTPAEAGLDGISVTDIIYREAKKLQAEVDQIRITMGLEEIPSMDVKFLNVELRHVYFATQVTFQKADKLAQKLANAGPGWTPYPEGDVETLVDLLDLIQASREQLAKIRLALNITDHIEMPSLDSGVTMIDILSLIGSTGNQINAILNPRVEWASIYDQLQLAISYIAGVLPEHERYPQLPAIRSDVATLDVLKDMESVRVSLQKVGDRHGVKILRTEHGSGEAYLAGLSTVAVSDIMTIINADLAELTLKLNPQEAEMPSYPRPEVIESRHVDQLLNVLEKQLDMLENVTETAVLTSR